jgi:hypothetical protein
MSRTYRKSSITEQQSLVEYINDHIKHLKRRSFYYEYYLTDAGQKAYDKAVEEWETEYYNWLYNEKKQGYWFRNLYSERVFRFNHPPEQPILFHFKKRRVVYKEIDYDKEINEATEEYKKYKRDGRFYEGSLNRAYKKHCASDLRRLNRELARKIIKYDDSWEQKPYPDTYLGKQYVWDYW